ncbi:MAG: polysaccharide biosynthesis tyrosine autokinase [Gammaproteobacteria bacterium]|nr:polysaccharide biosynthesis tyrosine autokinase [Gammaproteobacteria bacterium]
MTQSNGAERMQQTFQTSAQPTDRALGTPGPAPSLGADRDDDEIDLGRILATLLDYKWLILSALILGAVVGLVSYYLTTPRYQVTALIQVEQKSAGAGTVSMEALAQFQPVFSGFDNLAAEQAIIRSRALLGMVVDRLNLDIQANPLYFPVVGAPIARRFSAAEGVAKPWFGQEDYAWGGELIEVTTFLLPDRLRGARFLLTAEEGGAYRLDLDDIEVLRGVVGERAEGTLDGARVALFVSYLKARPGTRFEIIRRSDRGAVDSLRGALNVAQNPRGSNILEVTIEGDHPQRAAAIVNTIVATYQQRNVESKSAQADRTLEYLDTQVPTLRERLEVAEAAYNDYRLQQDSVDIQHETRVILDSLVELESRLFTLSQQRDELRQLYTEAHPKIQSVDRAIAQMIDRQRELDERMKRLPTTQQTVLGLAREVEVTTTIYQDLINAIQQLQIAKAGTVASISMIDEALAPNAPFKPIKQRNLAIATVLGLFLGIGLALLLARLRGVVERPEEIERQLGLSVYASIPRSLLQLKSTKPAGRKSGESRPAFVLAVAQPDDPVVETFRSLRTSLHFLLLESKNNILLVTGPRPGVGKTFVSLNLAVVLAQGNKRVLLIDADMRLGHVHEFLGIPNELGLSEYIAGQANTEQAIKSTTTAGLSLIPTGTKPPNPSELLMSERFSVLLQEVSGQYDYVILDAPPALVVADAGVMAMQAGATLLVARSDTHHISELEMTVKRLLQAGANVRGFVLNDVQRARGYGYGYGYGYGGYKPYRAYADAKRQS